MTAYGYKVIKPGPEVVGICFSVVGNMSVCIEYAMVH